MSDDVLNDLLTTLEVRLHAFAVCEVQRGWRLVFEPMDAVVVHFVLSGAGVLHMEGTAPVVFGPQSILVVVPRRGQSLAGGADPVRQDVVAGESCLMPRDGLARFKAREGEADLVTVCATVTAVYGGGFGLFDDISAPLVDRVEGTGRSGAVFQALLEEISAPGLGGRAMSEALMKQCFILLLRNQASVLGERAPFFTALRDPRLARVVTAVLAEPAAAQSLSSLAAIAGMSRSAFAKRFAEVYGQSPFVFVQKARLHQAAIMLRASELPVKVIAASVGFASRSHFSRAFRAAFGVDPTAFRERGIRVDELAPPPVRALAAVADAPQRLQ